MIKRDEYLKKLIGYRNKRIIKVITGIRRSGKSTLLEMYRSYLLDEGVSADKIIHINFEDLKYLELLDYKKLYTFLEDIIKDGFYTIILDEVQNVENFQLVVNSLFLKDNIDIFITGSNAYMLSGELATYLSGRYVEINILPLSFKEYVVYLGKLDNLQKSYNNYIQLGSFPYLLQLDTEEQIKEYLRGIYSTVVLKDIMSRNKISDVMMLESVINFMLDNIGNILSTKKVSDTMTSHGRKINVRTVESYLTALVDSYIFYEVKRYDVKGRQHLKTLSKYYVVDIGFRNLLLGKKGYDIGFILENIVFLELIRRGYNVYVGKVGVLEIDFVATKGDETRYFQVAASVRDQVTLDRELKSLIAVSDSYEKSILTLDDDPVMDYDGIKVMNVLDFLVNN
ncbi:MAG: ATP-binding protein [Firmicutes bacterium]|nr:ATP-binding protein [Bacillota bacterium]